MMKQCRNCKTMLAAEDIFCKVCGTKYEEGQAIDSESSLFLKYAGYLDDESLFKVAWAKEQGIVKSDSPNEVESIYRMLALKGHQNSMFRYAMVLLNKGGSQEDAKKWLTLAASKGHVESINYLKMMMPDVQFEDPTSKQVTIINPTNPTEPVSGMSGEQVFAKLQNAVVEIYATDSAGAARASGFVVSSTGFIITNAHAVLNAQGEAYKTINVRHKGKFFDAKLLAVGKPSDGKNDSVDLAVLFSEGIKGSSVAEFGDSASCRNGQKVYLIGNSLGDGTCITSGIISDTQRAMPGLSYPYIMTDAAANQGNSGGPLVDENGKVIGVLVSGIQIAEGMNFAIPINTVKEFLSYIVNSIKLPPQALGELYTDAPSSMSVTDKIFSGLHIALDVIAFILSLI
ncbi:MAG: trypsin-like peptidase domain-containing protein [Clostridia bacterium]|nr:trypsin-like peptidase domain-containing protein [Clostridia bacterium]